MWSSSEEGSYLKAHRLVYHSTLGSRVIKKECPKSDSRNLLHSTQAARYSIVGPAVGVAAALLASAVFSIH